MPTTFLPSFAMTTFVIVKRDGTYVPFDATKLRSAIRRAYAGCREDGKEGEAEAVERACEAVAEEVAAAAGRGGEAIDIEDVQRVVENVLMDAGAHAVARSYITYRHERQKRRAGGVYDVSKIPDDVATPWGEVGYVTYKRTYSREGGAEELRDSVLRVLRACQTQLRVGFTNDELREVYRHMMSLKCSVAGRFLWQLGTETVERLGLMSLQNCAFVVIDSPIRPFLWTFDSLMLGVGVGFNIQRENVAKLPPLLAAPQPLRVERKDTADADFIVPDSREGWGRLLEHVLRAFFETGQGFTYSTVLVRPHGTPIKGFGGTASGPGPLVAGVERIVEIMNARRGEKLTTVDVLDVVNIIASIVVAGNVRRSALIAIGDCDDIPYLRAKRWDLGGIPNWRCMSNNSVVCSSPAALPEEFWEGYRGNGEPYGLINLDLARRVGRAGEERPDGDVQGFNPCAEQPLANHETCCLAEIFLPNVESYEELERVAKALYRICKHSLALPCHHKETQEVVHRHMRMGLGVTGYMMVPEEKKAWLPTLYSALRAYDEQYSKLHNFPPSIRLTTVKPSGTLSLLPGVTPGAHPGIYQHFIRRIRMASSSPLVALCRARGYEVEPQRNFDGTSNHDTSVVSFPCAYPQGTVLAKDMTAVAQLEVVRRLQREWSDNAVSVTIYYRKEEVDAIRAWLAENYEGGVKSCSFLLHNDHGFDQAPYEEISEERYREMVARVTPIVGGVVVGEDEGVDATFECAGGMCPVR